MRFKYANWLIFFASLSVLAFEITLVRIFSITLSYHYASVIISVSMTGLVLGGLLAYFRGNDLLRSTPSASVFLARWGLTLSFSFPALFFFISFIPFDYYRILWENRQILYLGLFILACALPFFIYGVIISSSLIAWREEASIIYAFDLLGAAGGVVLAVTLLNHLRIEHILVVISFVAGAAALWGLEHTISRGIFLLVLAALCAPLATGIRTLPMSPYKGLMQALKEDDSKLMATFYSSHSRLDLFKNPHMRFAPGLSFAYTEPVPDGEGIALDGEVVGVAIDERELPNYRFFTFMPSALPYLLRKPEKVVVVGCRSGLDVLEPYYFGASNVIKTEKDLTLFRFIQTHYTPGSLYRRSLHYTSGRNLVQWAAEKADLIFLSRAGFFPAGAFGLQEDYDITAEALKVYLSSLKPEGLLFIQLFLLPPPRYELRLMNNILAALTGGTSTDISGRLIVYRSWDTINFLVKNGIFSRTESETVRRFLTSRQFEMLYPDLQVGERFITGLDYKGLFLKLADEKQRQSLMEGYPFDTRPTTDDRPFFHYFLKLSTLRTVYTMTGRKWAYFIHEGMFLPFMLAFLILLALLVFAVTFLLSRWVRQKQDRPVPPRHFYGRLSYFALIGISFMFVEVFFVHRLILPFNSPTAGFSITLVAILLSSGLGSMASSYLRGKNLFRTMSLIPFLIAACLLTFDEIGQSTYAFVPIIPLGIMLGFFFPTGIRFLTARDDGSVPLAYALNGAASIIAAPFASVMGVALGLKILLLASAILYGAALFMVKGRLSAQP
ncbi:MAG: hypothetical protein A4E65_00871 [Syntrophorhabdus sp. PtaU1.Bin153]|nr:MAG: hypothetical protein A4E65_00871 [Syntrophorhabdus sp. PtaU1.Bin153]